MPQRPRERRGGHHGGEIAATTGGTNANAKGKNDTPRSSPKAYELGRKAIEGKSKSRTDMSSCDAQLGRRGGNKVRARTVEGTKENGSVKRESQGNWWRL